MLFGKKGDSKGDLVVELLEIVTAPVKKGDLWAQLPLCKAVARLAKINMASLGDVREKIFGDWFKGIVRT